MAARIEALPDDRRRLVQNLIAVVQSPQTSLWAKLGASVFAAVLTAPSTGAIAPSGFGLQTTLPADLFDSPDLKPTIDGKTITSPAEGRLQ